MARLRKPSLRGSVTQQTPSIRLNAHASTRGHFLIRIGMAAGAAALILGIVLWLWHIGWPQRQAEHLANAALNLTQRYHFAITDIQVEGRQQTSKDTLSSALGTTSGAAILAFDPAAAEARISKLPWVASAIVERHLPDTILVKLVERVPLARWQHDGRTIVIDTEGHELPDAPPDQFIHLPLVAGAGAAAEARVFLETLKDYPSIAEKMSGASWVGLRRWDIYLTPKIIVRMPEGGLDHGLKRLADLISDQKILERDIVAIDLRFPDRVIMESGHPLPAEHTSGDSHL